MRPFFTVLILVALILCSVSFVLADDVSDLRMKIDGSQTVAEAESYKGAVQKLPDLSDRDFLLKKIDARKAALTRGTPEIGSLVSKIPWWSGPGLIGVIVILFAIIALLKRRKHAEEEDGPDITEVTKDLDKEERFTRQLGVLLHEKKVKYDQVIDLLNKMVLKEEKDISDKVDGRFAILSKVERRTRPLEEHEFWIFSRQLSLSQRRSRLESFADDIKSIVGNGGSAVQDVIDDMEYIAEFLDEHHLHPSVHNIKEALRVRLTEGSLKYDAGLFDKISALRKRQVDSLNEFFALEHHEIKIINRYHHNLQLKEKNLRELDHNLAGEDERIIKRVEIEDEHLEGHVKELVSKFILLRRKLEVYNTLLEGELEKIARTKRIPKEFTRLVIAGDVAAAKDIAHDCRSAIDEIRRDMQKEEDLFFELSGALAEPPFRVDDDAPGLLGQLRDKINDIGHRERQIKHELKSVKKEKKVREKYSESVLIGALEIASGHTALAVKRFGKSKGMGREIYLTRSTMLTANPAHNKRGFVYANIATNEADIPIAVHDKFSPPMYTWNGDAMKQGQTYRFGDLELVFKLKGVPKGHLKDFSWGKVLVTKLAK